MRAMRNCKRSVLMPTIGHARRTELLSDQAQRSVGCVEMREAQACGGSPARIGQGDPFRSLTEPDQRGLRPEQVHYLTPRAICEQFQVMREHTAGGLYRARC